MYSTREEKTPFSGRKDPTPLLTHPCWGGEWGGAADGVQEELFLLVLSVESCISVHFSPRSAFGIELIYLLRLPPG